MTFKQICQLGFGCPYHRISDDGDDVCIYPYIRITEREEDETFGFPEESDCPLMNWDSPLEKWRTEYEGDEIPDEVLDALIAKDQKNEMEKNYRGPEE